MVVTSLLTHRIQIMTATRCLEKTKPAATTVWILTLQPIRLAFRQIALDDDLMRELAADFSCLGQVLASVPLWVRLSSDPSVLDALCHQDGWSKPPEFKNATACGVSVASDELLDAFSALDVGSELHAVASELQRSADVPIEDDFDAWLDDA
jgi:hypothetical protein